MTPLSALDISNIRFHRISPWAYSHECPWCGGEAWSGREHTQCLNKSCHGQVAAPLDIVAHSLNLTHVAADALVAPRLGRQADPAGAALRARQRKVLDFWIGVFLSPYTNAERQLSTRFTSRGLGLPAGHMSTVVLGADRMLELMELAQATGASYPDAWDAKPPEAALVYSVQSIPHTIDRLVVVRGKSSPAVIWHQKKAGISGLIGLSPNSRKYLAPDRLRALQLQSRRLNGGVFEEVASVFYDHQVQASSCEWSIDGPLLTAVVGVPDDVVSLQRGISSFPDMESTVDAVAETGLLGISAETHRPSWGAMRRSVIETLTSPTATRLSAASALVFEQTGSRPDDAAALQVKFLRDGRLRLAEDLKRLAANRTIYDERGVTVRETVNEYHIRTPNASSVVANFAVRPESVVIFRDRGGEIYYKSKLFYGKRTADVLVSQMAFESPKNLKEELLGCIITEPTDPADHTLVPTVIDPTVMKVRVLPYLRGQVAYLPSMDGLSRLGWSQDRTEFRAPGITIDLNGRRETQTVFHPALPTLRAFKPVEQWSSTAPETVHKSCQTVISLMLALTVRFFKRCVLRPACVRQTSESARLIEFMARQLGQQTPYELGMNARERSDADGIYGYPFVATGYGRRQLLQASVPYVILTDTGLSIDEGPDATELEEGGRALQFALARVVEWCIATGADEFKEQAHIDFNTSLLREGQWLAENVCKLQPWEQIDNTTSPLVELLSQIPAEETVRRLKVVNSIHLHVDLRDLQVDTPALERELLSLGAEPEFRGQVVVMLAARVVPSIYGFYGNEPDIAVEDTEPQEAAPWSVVT